MFRTLIYVKVGVGSATWNNSAICTSNFTDCNNEKFNTSILESQYQTLHSPVSLLLFCKL